MKVSAKLSKEAYSYNKESITHLLVELEAPKVEWDKDRSPICIVPVLDVSGSMEGEKIDYVRKACRKLIDHLSVGDLIGLVAFDTNVHEIHPICEITQAKKEELKLCVSNLRTGDCTNLSGGLLTALKWINKMDLPEKTILRVIVFTDGHANVGTVGKHLLPFLNEHKGKVSISCFGFGTECDQELLADMSVKGEGNYAFIDSPDAALKAFARELGGLMSTYAQNISVGISSDKHNEILEVLNDEDVVDKDGEVNIKFRDILGEEKKFVVARVKLNEVSKPLPRLVNAFTLNISYLDKFGHEQIIEDKNVKIRFCQPCEESSSENTEVVKHRDRLIARKAQIEAEKFARAGQFSQASYIITNATSKLCDADVKDLMNTVSVNYSNAQAYACSGGINATVGSTLGGHRYSYSSCNISPSFCYTSSAMDAMEKSFSKDEDGEPSTTITVSPSDKDTIQSSTYIDATKLNIDPNVVFVPSFSVIPTPEDKKEKKATANKKRSGKDW